jgi:hypothetical protein
MLSPAAFVPEVIVNSFPRLPLYRQRLCQKGLMIPIFSVICLMMGNKFLKGSKYFFLVKTGKVELPAQMVNA